MQFQYSLAEHLHKTVAEIQEMDAREFYGWVAWFKLKEDARGSRKI